MLCHMRWPTRRRVAARRALAADQSVVRELTIVVRCQLLPRHPRVLPGGGGDNESPRDHRPANWRSKVARFPQGAGLALLGGSRTPVGAEVAIHALHLVMRSVFRLEAASLGAVSCWAVSQC
jgi:hypothetical protein